MLDIKQDVLLSKYTTFRIGGPAKFFVEVKNEEELTEALKYAKDNNLDFFILGGGSNLLVSDNGFNGIIIKIQDTRYKIQKNIMEAGAGTPLALVVNESVNNGLTGMEWAAGIPGTVGGAVRGNAGAFGSSMSDAVESVKVLNIEESGIRNYESGKCEFGYRNSIFKQDKNLLILSVTIKLESGNKEESQKKVQEIIAKRVAKQPKGVASAGSFFMNPVVKDEKLKKEFEEDRSIKCKGNKIPAGWLIDQAGLKGKKIGGAMVSEEHTNFIVNTGDATAEDVIMLVSLIKQQVRDKFGVELESEVQYLGF